MNLRPAIYETAELPGCSTPLHENITQGLLVVYTINFTIYASSPFMHKPLGYRPCALAWVLVEVSFGLALAYSPYTLNYPTENMRGGFLATASIVSKSEAFCKYSTTNGKSSMAVAKSSLTPASLALFA